MPVLDHASLLARQRCTAQFAELGVDPIGTSGSPPGGFVLFELPLPWPSDVLTMPELAELGDVCKSFRARPQALVPEPSDLHGPDHRTTGLRVIAYVPGRPGGPVMLRREAVAGDVSELAGVAHRVLTDALAGIVDEAVLDILVCTHGTRDVCCGAVGSALHSKVTAEVAAAAAEAAAADDAAAAAEAEVRVWRTSHTGGHRFAPTAITFPNGLTWGWMGEVSLLQAARGELPLEVAAAHLRGAASVRGGFAQTVDREAFKREGWPWLSEPRSVVADEAHGEGLDEVHVVRIEGRGADGERIVHEGRVGVRREVPVPPCGVPIEEAHKTDREYEVLSFGGGE